LPKFLYEAINSSGNLVKKELEAGNINDAVFMLKSKGLSIISIKAAEEPDEKVNDINRLKVLKGEGDKTFRYQMVDAAGNVQRGTINANSIQSAAVLLRDQGFTWFL